MAMEAGMDLVEISPNTNPPVCKIMDYGKFKYSAQKKAAEARKKQKVVEIKEIKLRPMIDDHDYDVKMRAMQRFAAAKWPIRRSAQSFWTRSRATSLKSRRSSRTRVSKAGRWSWFWPHADSQRLFAFVNFGLRPVRQCGGPFSFQETISPA
jgi:hypothetical protein